MLVRLLTPTYPGRSYTGLLKEIIMTTLNHATPVLTVNSRTEGMNVSGRTFYECLAKINAHIPFDPTWANGTGYYNSATKAEVLEGTWCWSHDPGTNRFLVLIGTRFGTICIFERYSHGTKSPVIVANCPRKGYVIWQLAGLNGQLNERVLSHALGDPDFPTIAGNIGMQVEQMSQLFLKFNE